MKLIQLVLFYLCSLEGVPLAYENISILGHHGSIYDDSGYIHMNIQANFILFQPERGQTLLVRFTCTALSRCFLFTVSSSDPQFWHVDTFLQSLCKENV